MTTSPLLSILTPAYNEEPYLQGMVRSLQQQDDPRWELLLVDDGSTDGTAAEMHRLAAAEDRVRVVSTGTKLWKVPAFNTAFAASRGTHVCHVGADDVVPPISVGARLASIPAHGERVSFGKFRTMDVDGSFTSGPLPRGDHGSRSSAGTTMTRELAQRLFPIPEHLVAEDLWLGHGAAALAEQVVTLPEVIYHYRLHAGNSNPRSRPFPEMNEKMFARGRAFEALLSDPRIDLPDPERDALEVEWAAAQYRYRGDLLGIVRDPRIGPVDTLANLSMAHPLLWRLRQRFQHLLTGWRGR